MEQNIKKIIELAYTQDPDEKWFALPEGGVILIRRPTEEEIENIHGLLHSEISMSTVSLQVIRGVYNHNRDCIWGIYRAKDETRQSPRLVGVYGLLHLNEAGHVALERGEFDASNPDLSLVVRYGDRPSAIYIWGIVARGVLRIVTQLVAVALGKKLYGGLPYYATAGTMGGLSTINNYGFKSIRQTGAGLGDLFRRDPPPVPARSKTEAA